MGARVYGSARARLSAYFNERARKVVELMLVFACVQQST